MGDNAELVELEGDVVGTAEKAIRVRFTGVSGDPVIEWFPKSQLREADGDDQDVEDLDEGDYLSTMIPQWLAEEKGVV
jgi:hypothetical protein